MLKLNYFKKFYISKRGLWALGLNGLNTPISHTAIFFSPVMMMMVVVVKLKKPGSDSE